MKKLFSILLTVSLVFSLAACAGSGSGTSAEAGTVSTEEPETIVVKEQTTGQSVTGTTESAPEEASSKPEDTPAAPSAEAEAEAEVKEPEQNSSKILVVVFSATGTTKGVAEKIAAIENADLYEIKAAEEYTDDDLNWHDSHSRSTLEQNDKNARPAIGSESISPEGYEKIYIGFPIWWGEEPRILDTFVESYDFDGITMIPFCTSSSSGIGRSGQNLADAAGSGNWLEGKRFGGNASEADLQAWIDSLK